MKVDDEGVILLDSSSDDDAEEKMGAPVTRGSAPTVVPQKRGPPRKRPSQASLTRYFESPEPQKNAIASRKTPPAGPNQDQTPRKRGRPRKDPNDTAPRKRGRPRKNPNDSAPRKKRTRRYESDDDDDEESDDPDTDETEVLEDDDDVFESPSRPKAASLTEPATSSVKTKAKPIKEPIDSAAAVVVEQVATVPVSRLAYELVVARREADRQSQIMLEGFSFSDLQAQQRELELFQLRKKQRRRAKTRDAQGSAESSHSDESSKASAKPPLSSFSPPSSECERSHIVYVMPPPKFCESEGEMKDATLTFPPVSRVKTQTNVFVDATVVHPTAWRRLRFTEAPSNILRVDMEPYANGSDLSLEAFDATGSVAEKCRLEPPTAVSPHTVPDRVRSLMVAELPALRTCHEKRAKAILNAMRSDLAKYRSAYRLPYKGAPSISTMRILEVQTQEPRFVRLQRTTHSPTTKTPMDEQPISYAIFNATEVDDVNTKSLMENAQDESRERVVNPIDVIYLSETIPPLRPFRTCIGVKTSMLVADDAVLRYVPYLANEHAIPIEAERYTSTTMDPRRMSLLECGERAPTESTDPPLAPLPTTVLDDEIMECFLRIVIAECGESQAVYKALEQIAGIMQPLKDYKKIQKNAENQKRVTEHTRILEEMRSQADVNNDSSHAVSRPWALLSNTDGHPSLTTQLKHVTPFLDSNYARYPDKWGLRKASDLAAIVGSYRDLFCRMCYNYDCVVHGTDYPLPSRRSDPVYPIVAGQLKRRHQSRIGIKATTNPEVDEVIEISSSSEEEAENEDLNQLPASAEDDMSSEFQTTEVVEHLREFMRVTTISEKALSLLERDPSSPCGVTCWKQKPISICPRVFKDEQMLMLQKLMAVYGENACAITATLAIPKYTCAEIACLIKSNEGLLINSSDLSLSHHCADIQAQTKKKHRLQRQLHQAGINETCYEACKHEGDCVNCSCREHKYYCERACVCSSECANRFPGCDCDRSSSCRTSACPCFRAGRECDPDLCIPCGACEIALLELQQELKRKPCWRGCDNVNLLRGEHKKIMLAFSSTHGYGAFARGPISQGEFICEYTGALISGEEAERRGAIYDMLGVSFLFKLNGEQDIDAARMGNKTKFVNHGPRAYANCEAKITTVRGEHRIALYATASIATGEELTFDYHFIGEKRPEWLKRIRG